jgi:hypothetical protein
VVDGYDYCDPVPHCCNRVDFTKDADETLDFSFNYAPKLGEDTILTSVFSLPDGLSLVSQSNDTDSATIFVSGGSAGRIYRIENTITTAGGREYEKTLYVQVTDC